jgi:hypothetical protein
MKKLINTSVFLAILALSAMVGYMTTPAPIKQTVKLDDMKTVRVQTWPIVASVGRSWCVEMVQ